MRNIFFMHQRKTFTTFLTQKIVQNDIINKTSPTLQGPVIENISQRCGGFLKFLSLKGCQSVGDQSIRTLANHCHNIEHLDLSECKKITDHAMQPLSKHCFKLTAIFLESCAQISDMSLKALSDGCPVRLLFLICKLIELIDGLFVELDWD